VTGATYSVTFRWQLSIIKSQGSTECTTFV